MRHRSSLTGLLLAASALGGLTASETAVGPFKWVAKLADPTAPAATAATAVGLDGSVETVSLNAGSTSKAGSLATFQWSGSNQAGGRSWAANTLKGAAGKNYFVGMDSWAITEASGLGDAWYATHRFQQDAHFRLAFCAAKVTTGHAGGFEVGGPMPGAAVVLTLTFRNVQGADAAWQMGAYNGNPIEVGVWQVPAGQTLAQAQANAANRLSEVQVITETNPRVHPVMAKLQVQNTGAWQVRLDLDGDNVVDVDLLSTQTALGHKPYDLATLGAISEANGLLIGTLPAGGVSSPRVGRTPITLRYKYSRSSAITAPCDRRPFTVTFPVASVVSPARIVGNRWSTAQTITVPGGVVSQAGDTVFHAKMPLRAGALATATVKQSGTPVTSKSGKIAWTPTDLWADNAPLTIRRGDKLLFTFSGGCGTGPGVLTIDTDGNGTANITGVPGKLYAWAYNTPGVYTVQARLDGATVVDGIAIPPLTVTVADALLPDAIACEVGYARIVDIDCGTTPPTSIVAAAQDPALMQITELANIGHIKRITLKPLAFGTPVLELRSVGAAEPVLLDVQEVSEFDLRDENGAVIPVIQTYPDGSRLVQATIRMAPLVAGLDVDFRVFVSGATLDDGAILRRVRSDAAFSTQDDGSGVYPLKLIMGPQLASGPCHSMAVWQGGVQVGQ